MWHQLVPSLVISHTPSYSHLSLSRLIVGQGRELESLAARKRVSMQESKEGHQAEERATADGGSGGWSGSQRLTPRAIGACVHWGQLLASGAITLFLLFWAGPPEEGCFELAFSVTSWACG